MSEILESQMLDALELFHYSYKFRNHLFVIVLEDSSSIDEMMLDFRLLYSSHIQTIILHGPSAAATKTFNTWHERGFHFHHHLKVSPEEIDRILENSDPRDSVDVFELNLKDSNTPAAFTMASLAVAQHTGADKIFFLGKDKGIVMGDQFLSHPNPEELESQLIEPEQFNIDSKKLALLIQEGKKTGVEAVILESKMGSLFEEIFTHRGSGSLLTSDYPNIIRQGKSEDLTDLLMLIKHEVRRGSILPVNEEDIAAHIENYFVFTVNDSIVASATLIDYEKTAELAKFCTLPRYQGKGRARKLALSMIKKARELHKEYVFALSINEKMWDFFIGLGFHEVSRETLPQTWQKQYHFSRPSKAFRMDL